MDNSVDIDCQPNTSHFIAVATFDFSPADDTDIEVVSEDEGTEAVLERHLLVTW